MFKDYKGILKDLHKMQDQLWKDSVASFPGSAFPQDMNEWQQKNLENINNLVEKAVSHSLELQREWLGQWTERASGRKLKPKLFADLNAEASNSTQRWLDNQYQLWDQWLEVLRGSSDPTSLPDFEEWEKAIEESFQRQMALLSDWSELGGVKKLSVKEATKLSNRIEEAMQKSIETQQRLWSHWFDELGTFGEVEEKTADIKPKKKTKAAEKPAIKATKVSAKRVAKPRTTSAKSATKPRATSAKPAAKSRKKSAKPAQSDDDLKQISGIGPGLEKKLKDAGITSLRQIANWNNDDIAQLEGEIIRFSGRIKREKWVEQARKLVS